MEGIEGLKELTRVLNPGLVKSRRNQRSVDDSARNGREGKRDRKCKLFLHGAWSGREAGNWKIVAMIKEERMGVLSEWSMSTFIGREKK